MYIINKFKESPQKILENLADKRFLVETD